MDNQQLQTTQGETGVASVGNMNYASLVRVSKEYPRDIAEFKAEAKDLAVSTYDTARSCIYFRPCGRKNG